MIFALSFIPAPLIAFFDAHRVPCSQRGHLIRKRQHQQYSSPIRWATEKKGFHIARLSAMVAPISEERTEGDLMGDYANRVFAVVRRIPRGKVATYGQVARLIGAPRTARYVGYALHANPEPGTDPGCIPCHRVVFKDGRMATGFAFGGPDEQRGMLAARGDRLRRRGPRAHGRVPVGRPSGKRRTRRERHGPPAPPPDFDWEAKLAEHPLHHCETCAAPRPDCKKERHA